MTDMRICSQNVVSESRETTEERRQIISTVDADWKPNGL